MEKKKIKPDSADALYTLKATLIRGLLAEKFVENNPEVSRTIEIKGSQTLQKLHYAIYDSVDFDDEHLYEFEVGGKKPLAKGATKYTLQVSLGAKGWSREPDGKGVIETKLSSLGLKPKQKFFYRFDFGDEWWWEIEVVSIGEEIPKGKYPRVTERVGDNPPQYPDPDEEEEEWDEPEIEEG
ncbi:MAG: hypothetical protein NTY09_14540 [bacterium]|nr:hypothetical protein [bacterium]